MAQLRVMGNNSRKIHHVHDRRFQVHVMFGIVQDSQTAQLTRDATLGRRL
jgi:hypothetical protein